jgi:hypothetical protein
MTENNITPPPELRCEWQSESPFKVISVEREDYMIDRAAQWGADQELQACCEWLENQPQWMEDLRAARRPKPPTLKEQALEMLENAWINNNAAQTIRRALEALPE